MVQSFWLTCLGGSCCCRGKNERAGKGGGKGRGKEEGGGKERRREKEKGEKEENRRVRGRKRSVRRRKRRKIRRRKKRSNMAKEENRMKAGEKRSRKSSLSCLVLGPFRQFLLAMVRVCFRNSVSFCKRQRKCCEKGPVTVDHNGCPFLEKLNSTTSLSLSI